MIIELMILASALYVGFNIGSNDAANCMGACVGGGALGLRRAMVLAAIFALLGGVIAGSNVARTISGNIIPQEDLTPTTAVVCLLASGCIVAIATLRGIPVSTSHAIVFALVGASLAIKARLNSEEIFSMAAAWTLLPIAIVPLSYSIISLLNRLLSRVTSMIRLEIILRYLLIFSGIYASFALGANHAGLAGGMLEGVDILGHFSAKLAGSLAIGLGVLVLSHRVIRTVGEGITALGPTSAFAMQISAAIGLTVCSLLGIPVSSSQCIVAAAIGVGLAQGVSTLNRGQVAKITAYWIMVPVSTMLVAYVVMLQI